MYNKILQDSVRYEISIKSVKTSFSNLVKHLKILLCHYWMYLALNMPPYLLEEHSRCKVTFTAKFFHIISQNGTISRKRLLNIKCVFWFSLQHRLKKKVFIPVRIQRDVILNARRSSNTKFHGNPSRGSQVVTDGQTDVMMLIVAFHNSAKAPKNNKRFYLLYIQITSVLCYTPSIDLKSHSYVFLVRIAFLWLQRI
jgi:hypothetical protein